MKLVVSGGKKLCLRSAAGTLTYRFLLTSNIVHMLVAFCNTWADALGLSAFILIAWKFLGRVQSQIFPLERGSAEDLVSLLVRRHSAATIVPGKCKSSAMCAIRWRS